MDNTLHKKILAEIESRLAQRIVDAKLAREDFNTAVRTAYRDPEAAFKWIFETIQSHGPDHAIKILEEHPHRFGDPRAAWYTPELWQAGGFARAKEAQEAIGRLPDLARALGQAQEKEQAARRSHDQAQREYGRDVDERHALAPTDDDGGQSRRPDSVPHPKAGQPDDLDWLRQDIASGRRPSDNPDDHSSDRER